MCRCSGGGLAQDRNSERPECPEGPSLHQRTLTQHPHPRPRLRKAQPRPMTWGAFPHLHFRPGPGAPFVYCPPSHQNFLATDNSSKHRISVRNARHAPRGLVPEVSKGGEGEGGARVSRRLLALSRPEKNANEGNRLTRRPRWCRPCSAKGHRTRRKECPMRTRLLVFVLAAGVAACGPVSSVSSAACGECGANRTRP